MHSAQELVSELDALVCLPSIYQRVREELASPDGSVTELGRLLGADPALTTRLLRVVNSALYGYGGQVDTVGRAVQILGLQQVHDLVLAMSLSSVFSGIRPEHLDLARFWRGSMLCALAARCIARSCGLPTAERLFVLGLLADIGHLAMYQLLPEKTSAAQAQADLEGVALHEAERRLIGCDHAEVGAALMAHWRLPPCFVEVLGAQIDPRLGGDSSFDAAIVHVARQIVEADRRNEASQEAAARVDSTIWSQLGLPPSALAGLREEAELNLAGYISLFFPKPGSN